MEPFSTMFNEDMEFVYWCYGNESIPYNVVKFFTNLVPCFIKSFGENNSKISNNFHNRKQFSLKKKVLTGSNYQFW